MKVQVLQHVEFEGLGSIAAWLATHAAEVSYTRLYEHSTFPDETGIDLVVAMGGPMSVNDEQQLPWLRDEKRFLREVIDRGVPVLGVCLGAQLLASALGSRVFKNPHREIGWFPVCATPAPNAFQFPKECRVFHWHGETFDLPRGAIRLAKSDGCDNQAFQWGQRAIGLQFHLEMTPASIDAIIENCRNDIAPGEYVQSEAEMRNTPHHLYADANSLMSQVLDHLTSAAGHGEVRS